MPLKSYGVLTGRPIARREGSGSSPHYQILLTDDADQWRIAVNVQSQDGSEVMYAIRQPFAHPVRDLLRELPAGFRRAPPQPGGLALDFIRGNMADPRDFVPLPVALPGPDNDLNDKLDRFVQRAMADEDARVHAFGEPWGPEANKRDKYFGFLPGRGIHDIHMNQGNPPGRFAKDNGPWQDGGLVFHFPARDEWVAVFTKFQSQAWHTQDTSAEPLPLEDETPGIVAPQDIPTQAKPDGMVRIIAALVNATTSPERETVTLINASDVPVDLSGWQLKDRMKHAMTLDGRLDAGAVRTVEAEKPFELSNKGGIITLLDDRGVKVHGVAYTREQARQAGWTVVF